MCIIGGIFDTKCDLMQGAMAEKLRREIQRLMSETERLEKEVARQKSLR
jgi:hypothetical protein